MRRTWIIALCVVAALSIAAWAGKGGGGGKPGGGGGDAPADPAIAFVTFYNTLRVMNEDGSNNVALIEFGEQGLRFPCWSPDRQSIVFTGPGSSIYVVQADGTGLQQIVSNNNWGSGPSWSPQATVDGTYRIAYNGLWVDAQGAPRDGLFVVTPDGSDPINLQRAGPQTRCSWSPSATRIAVARNANGLRVHTLGLDAQGRIVVTDSPQYLAEHTITHVSWARTQEDKILVESGGDLQVLDLDGPANDGTPTLTNLTNTPNVDEYWGDWSPDDARIVFDWWGSGPDSIMTLLVADPTDRVQLYRKGGSGGYHSDPAWRR